MKTGYFPLTNRTNKYVKVIVGAIEKNNIEVYNANFNDKDFDYDIVNLNWYESIFKEYYLQAVIEYYKKKRYIKKLKKNNVKIIWTVHNKIPHDGKYTNFAKKLMKILLLESDSIVVHCKETIEILKSIDTEAEDIEKKVTYIPHPNYIGVYEDSGMDFREELGIKNEKVFLFFGQIRPYKNVEYIIDAAKKLDDNNIKFIIAGNPKNKSYITELKNRISDNRNIITMFRYIQDNEIVPLIKSADVVILPYDVRSSLNSGVAILAFTFGKTVICPYIGTLKDFEDKSLFYSYTYSNEKTHKVELNNIIEKCHKDIIIDGDSLQKKGERLKCIMNVDYSVDKVSTIYAELYNSLVR